MLISIEACVIENSIEKDNMPLKVTIQTNAEYKEKSEKLDDPEINTQSMFLIPFSKSKPNENLPSSLEIASLNPEKLILQEFYNCKMMFKSTIKYQMELFNFLVPSSVMISKNDAKAFNFIKELLKDIDTYDDEAKRCGKDVWSMYLACLDENKDCNAGLLEEIDEYNRMLFEFTERKSKLYQWVPQFVINTCNYQRATKNFILKAKAIFYGALDYI
ncbi:hypothetical protein BB561_001441 [Smittium simulii]|uniref:Uncharacterized protein n=1 Tax=Smittium simulii TaxID=133385 RepID=A0A2T9YUM6_9FUNG|nr:hypothetical protein BB561_001441 [Smittium simulii]